MAKIVFIPFPETGHVNPSFKLAKSLKSRGHQVIYLGIRDFEESVRMQQLEFLPIFESIFYKGYVHQAVVNGGGETFETMLLTARSGHQYAELFSELEQILRNIRPDIVIIDCLLSSVALMAKSLGISCILLNIQFFDPWEDPNRSSIYQALHDTPELVLCPQEFDFPRTKKRENCHYVEASIDLERRDVQFPWSDLSRDKQLIYCSLGSQSHLINDAQKVLQTVINAVSVRSDLQLVLTTGARLNPADFGAVASNIILVNQAPQLEILKRASITITHGGFNTVKECVFFGVPMIIFPLIRDHPAVAARVVHHGLGLRGKIAQISVEMVHAMINEIDARASFRRRCGEMSEIFRELEEAENSVKIVLSRINGSPVNVTQRRGA